MCSNKINNICNFPSDTATAEYNIVILTTIYNVKNSMNKCKALNVNTYKQFITYLNKFSRNSCATLT